MLIHQNYDKGLLKDITFIILHFKMIVEYENHIYPGE